MNLNEFFKKQLPDSHRLLRHPRITCKDGFSLSVQVNQFAYCRPRNDHGPWDQCEVGFPSAEPELIMGFAGTPEDPTGTVYSYVPVELVEQLIELHGGQKSD